jgi:hypothetical protein
MTLLVAALIVTGLIQYFQRRGGFGNSVADPAVAVARSRSSLHLSAIVFAGRWIAYYA